MKSSGFSAKRDTNYKYFLKKIIICFILKYKHVKLTITSGVKWTIKYLILNLIKIIKYQTNYIDGNILSIQQI